MNFKLSDLVRKFDRLIALHRYLIGKASLQNGLYLGQMPILEYIGQHENCTQREVADFVRVSAPSIATSVKRLQKAGLIEKRSDLNDLRSNRLSITEKGRRLTAACRQSFDQIDQLTFSGFSQDELAQLYDYLERLIGNLTSGERQALKDKDTRSLRSEADQEQILAQQED